MYAWIARLAGANDTSSNHNRPASRQRRPSRTKARFESLEPRAMLSADPTTQPAASSAPAAPAAPYYLPPAGSDNSDQTFVRNVYRELLGREPDAAGDAFWVNYLQQAQQNFPGTLPGAASNGFGTGLRTNTGGAFGSTFNGFNSGFAGTTTSNATGNITGPMDSFAGPLSGVSNVGPPSSFGTAGFGAGNAGPNGFGTSGFGNGGFSSQGAGTAGFTPIGPAGSGGSLNASDVNAANVFAMPGGTGTSSDTPREQFIDAILSSPEYRQHLVTAVYESFLHRAPGPQGISYWSNQLASGAGFEGLLIGVVGSPEYFSNAGGTANGFVQALYHDILGRSGSTAGVTYWTDRLNTLDHGQDAGGAGSTPAREALVNEFLATPEAQQLLASNSTNSALAAATGNGFNNFNNLFYQGGLNTQAQNQFFAEFEGNPAYDTAVRDLLSHSTYLTGPGAGSNPGPSFANPGSGVA